MGAGGSKLEERQRVHLKIPLILRRHLEETRSRRNQLTLKANKNTLSKKELLQFGNEDCSSRHESSEGKGNRSTSLPPHIEPLESASPKKVVPTSDDEVLGFTKTIEVTTTIMTTQTTMTAIEQDLGEERATKFEEKKGKEEREDENKIIMVVSLKEQHSGEERAATEVEEKKREEEKEDLNKIISVVPVKKAEETDEVQIAEEEDQEEEDSVVELMGGERGNQHFICPASPSFRIYLVDPPLNRNSRRDDAYVKFSQPVSAEKRLQRSRSDDRITIPQERLEAEMKKERKGRGFMRVHTKGGSNMRKAITRGGSTMRPNMRQLLNMQMCMSSGATAHRRSHSYGQ